MRLKAYTGKRKPIWSVPDWMVRLRAGLPMTSHRRTGKESSLDLIAYTQVQTRIRFLDTEKARKTLGYLKYDLNQALEDPVETSR